MKREITALLICGLAAASFATDFANKPYALNGDNGPFSENGGQQIADEFTSQASGQVGHVRLWGNYYGYGDPYNTGASLQFRIRFYDDNAGTPMLASFFDVFVSLDLTDTGVSQSGDTIYQFDGDISGPNLSMGTVYYFQALEADGSTSDSSFRWNNAADDGSVQFFRYSDTGSWSTEGASRANRAFVLSPVPEPASAAALGLGLLALMRRKR